ncbi:hypothetical protein DL96DRAFT_1683157 [Flagelloscypha sp. PMI_526]|nr:hypothetical protein DL96DRAFT_1683157 [Flagelloscypha sp. PMI_526]
MSSSVLLRLSLLRVSMRHPPSLVAPTIALRYSTMPKARPLRVGQSSPRPVKLEDLWSEIRIDFSNSTPSSIKFSSGDVCTAIREELGNDVADKIIRTARIGHHRARLFSPPNVPYTNMLEQRVGILNALQKLFGLSGSPEEHFTMNPRLYEFRLYKCRIAAGHLEFARHNHRPVIRFKSSFKQQLMKENNLTERDLQDIRPHFSPEDANKHLSEGLPPPEEILLLTVSLNTPESRLFFLLGKTGLTFEGELFGKLATTKNKNQSQ